jgi:TPP-dependent pyruvate/acetoin dehydrogenase alpha subunit
MAQALPVASSTLLRDLHAFLALEAPFLAAKLPEDLQARELEELLAAPRRGAWQGAGRLGEDELWPGSRRRAAARWSLESPAGADTGLLRRHELKAAIRRRRRLLMYRTMALTRAVDDFLKRAFDKKAIRWEEFPVTAEGLSLHRPGGDRRRRAAAAASSRQAQPGPDYDGDVIAPLIRDLGAALMFRPDPLHPILVQYGKKGTPMDGRDLHVGDLDWGVLPPAAPLAIATQTLAGLAYAWKLRGEARVGISFIGDGGSSLGEWHETVNLAAVQKLPLVFVVENNQWALGTHVSEQTATRRFALRAAGYGMPGATLFGNDPDEIAAGVAWAAERARAGAGRPARARHLSPHRPRAPRRRPLLRQPRGEDRRLRARGRAPAWEESTHWRSTRSGWSRWASPRASAAALRAEVQAEVEDAGAPRRRRRGRRRTTTATASTRRASIPCRRRRRARARARWPTTRRCARRSSRR